MLLQIFLDCRDQIKKPAYEEMLKQIANTQAKGPMATQQQVIMSLDNEASKDHEKLRKIIDYDILPELELRLHTLIKDINLCMDDLIKIKDEIPDDQEEKKVIEKVEGNDERDLVQRIEEINTEMKQLEVNLE